MFVLQLTGKFKRGNLLRRREKQQLAKPKVAIGMLNEVAALSSRDTADEEYVQQLQRTKAHRLTLVFGNAAFEEKYVAYHHAHWTPAALRARLLKFLGVFLFFAVFEDLLGSVRDSAAASKLTAYTGLVGVFLCCICLNEWLQWLDTRRSAKKSGLRALTHFRMPLHALFTLVWSFSLLGMAVKFEEIRYLSALLMPLLYAHSILHFRWLVWVYLLLAVIFELIWTSVLDGWNSEVDIAARGHSLHGVLLMASSLFLFVKYMREQDNREHFKLVELIELRKQQQMRGNALAQKLIANILPPFIVPQLGRHQSLARLSYSAVSPEQVRRFEPSKSAQVIAHSYSSISVIFATVLVQSDDGGPGGPAQGAAGSDEAAQLERVVLLDKVFSTFDGLLDSPPQKPGPTRIFQPANRLRSRRTSSSMYEKIKTVGNTYMVAAGIPHGENEDTMATSIHAWAAVELVCRMQRAVALLNRQSEGSALTAGGTTVQLRAGIHSGAVTAGVIGIEKYCFDIWGDTVNIASRMDSTGIPGQIQLSSYTKNALSEDDTVQTTVEFEPRGQMQIKGKGRMETYLVKGPSANCSANRASCSIEPVCNAGAAEPAQKPKITGVAGGVREGEATSPSVLTAPRVPLGSFSLFFEDTAAEAAFRTEYRKSVVGAVNASATLVLMFLLVFILATGCWGWLHQFDEHDESSCNGSSSDGSGGCDAASVDPRMRLAWLIVFGNTLLAVTMAFQVLATSARCATNFTQHMQLVLGMFSLVSIVIIFTMNVAADLIGYSQLLETPYILSGLIFVFFLSKLFVAYAARVCWTWLLAHTIYRYGASGLQSLFHAGLGSPLFLIAMTMMLHVLASDAERKIRQGHWLRTLADDQSKRLRADRKASDALLANCLPKSVINAALASAGGNSPNSSPHKHGSAFSHRSFELYREATILFVDIVNFTKLSSGMSPADLVSLLHDLVSQIDGLVLRYPVEKIKTIGDAYMVVSGLPEWREDHAEAVAEFALDLLDVVARFNESNRISGVDRPALAVRVGIDTATVIAGIVGDKKFCYDVWGAGVDGAAAMEQSGVANHIHLSHTTALRLEGLYHMKPASSDGDQTFFLEGRSKRVDFGGSGVRGHDGHLSEENDTPRSEQARQGSPTAPSGAEGRARAAAAETRRSSMHSSVHVHRGRRFSVGW